MQPSIPFCISHITFPSPWLGPPPPRSADHVFNVHRPRSMRVIVSGSQPLLLLWPFIPPPGLSNHVVHHGRLPSPGRLRPPPSRPYHTSAPERETAAVRLGPHPTGGLLTYFSWLRFTSNTTPRLLDHSSWRFPVLTLFFPTNLYTCTRILTAMKASSCLSILLTFPPLYVVIPVGLYPD